MSALMKTKHEPTTMGSDEIASLVESRHDNVKRAIERLAEKGVIQLPPVEEVKNSQGQSVSVYKLVKRDSYVVVAQLSPEFTARLVDRWQELEGIVDQPRMPQSMPEALRLAAEAIEQRDQLALENKVQAEALADAAPKVEALNRFANLEGKHTLRPSAKLLGVIENKLRSWLLIHRWYYRDHSGRLCAYTDKINAGYLDTIPVEIKRSEGIQVVQQPVILQKGLAKLAELLAKDGLLQRTAT